MCNGDLALGLLNSLQRPAAERIPSTPKDFTEEQMNEIEVLLDKLEDDEDVQAVFTDVN